MINCFILFSVYILYITVNQKIIYGHFYGYDMYNTLHFPLKNVRLETSKVLFFKMKWNLLYGQRVLVIDNCKNLLCEKYVSNCIFIRNFNSKKYITYKYESKFSRISQKSLCVYLVIRLSCCFSWHIIFRSTENFTIQFFFHDVACHYDLQHYNAKLWLQLA